MTMFIIRTGLPEGYTEVFSFTTGTLRYRKTFRIVTEDQALAHALFLERHRSSEEASCFLEDWLRRNR